MRTAIVLPLALLSLVALAPAEATIGTIQPGDAMTSGGAGCTMNYVFDGVGAIAGRVFIGTAAHCVSGVGASVSSWPYDNFGTVAVMGSAGSARADWALIEIAPEFHPRVKAAVKGHPDMPKGVATRETSPTGALVQLSGYGTVFGTAAPTQERRVGILTEYRGDTHLIVGPVVWGDSGGPLTLIEGGLAMGLNSRLCVVGPCTEYGPTIEGLIAQAAAKGFPVQLRTV